jgi:hypothetical protein
VVARAEQRLSSFRALVTGTFLFGWAAGVLLVLKSWRLFHAPRWMMVSGAGYVTFMLIPIICGIGVTRLSGRLISRGWGGTSVRFLALGLCGLVAGLMAL